MATILNKQSLNQALRAADRKFKVRDFRGAAKIYHQILYKFPKNKPSLDRLKQIEKHQQQKVTQKDINHLSDLYNSGAFTEALKAARLLLRGSPESALLHNISGAIQISRGEFNEAIRHLATAIDLKPNYAEAFKQMGNALNMGNATKDEQRSIAAINSYKKAIELKPDYAEAYYNLGVAYSEQSDSDSAILAFANCLKIESHFREAGIHLSQVLVGREFEEPNPVLEVVLADLLDKKSLVRPGDICLAAINLLKRNPLLEKHLGIQNTKQISQIFLDIVTDLCGIPLFLKLLGYCPIPDRQIEGLLTDLRSHMLFTSLETNVPESILIFKAILANQCFINEYVYYVKDSEEEIFIRKLEKIAKENIEKGEQPSPSIILSLASYAPLYQYDWHKFLKNNNTIADVYSCQILDSKIENDIRDNIENLRPISAGVSTKVAKQYEANPYPRWIETGLALRPMSIADWVKELNLKVQGQFLSECPNPNILIAGCGTGEHAISAASRYSDSKVLAVDLSLSSLAYAKRKTEELGISNIEYLHGDILDFGCLDKKFDLIECSGVLHHMENPKMGWEKLCDCLTSGGLMKVGLYSDLARRHIAKIRQEIDDLEIEPSDGVMRNYRNFILYSEEEHHELIRGSDDFYSLSNVRDLLFHVQEHRFTIPQIAECLESLNLSFCGFQTRQLRKFAHLHKDSEDQYDLEKWHRYEIQNPRAFAGMYQFWCQKIL